MIEGKSRFTATEFDVVPEDVYTLQIVDVNEAVLTYKGVSKDGYNFKFAILDNEDIKKDGIVTGSTRGRFLWWKVSDSIGKNANLYKIAIAALGRQLTEEEENASSENRLDLNNLIGLQLMGTVVINPSKTDPSKLYNNIVAVTKAKVKMDPVEMKPEIAKVVKTATKTVEEPTEKVEEEGVFAKSIVDDVLKDVTEEIVDDTEDIDDDIAALEKAEAEAKLKLAKLKAMKKAKA